MYISALWDSDERALNIEELEEVYHTDAFSQMPPTKLFACSLNNFILQLK